MRKLTNILVTGGAGFIGVNFIRFLFGETEEKPDFKGRIINLDDLTYAGNAGSLKEIKEKFGGSRYFFERGDICDRSLVENIFQEYEIDTIVHFAAESHVDRSILGPEAFVKTNVLGTFTLLECARSAWKNAKDVLFHHISTDEVYGSLGETGYFTENTPYDPHSPYSASKAASDHLVTAYYRTYGLPVTISNCSNNYGPYQFPEKLIPFMVMNMLEGKQLPVYGDGKNIRDWLYVDDHNNAVWSILQKGREGEKYNISGDNEWENIKLLNELIDIVAAKTNTKAEVIRDTITYVKDRPGHDRRYATDCSKIKKELGWKQTVNFRQQIERTVDWYLANREWVDSIRNGHYKRWIEKNYEKR
jgi:dTDP-glucose 4,6-dehydratase